MGVFKTRARGEAEDFVKSVKSIFAHRDDLVYRVESSVSPPNVISLNTAGKMDAWVEITFYNVRDPDTIFTPRQWMSFGERGWDIDTNNRTLPTMEFYKRFG